MTLLLLLAFGFSSISPAHGQDSKETRKPGSFSELKVYGRFEVTLVKGIEESVALTSEKINLNNVVTEIEDGKLKVRMKTNYFQDPEVKVTVTYKHLHEIASGAGARIDAGRVEADNLEIEAATGSEIKAEVSAERLETASTQGSTLTLAGTAKELEATVNTGGQLNAFPLIVATAKVKVTMGGYAKLTVTEKLDASVNMGGDISYKGNPKEVKRSGTMGGSITEIRE